MSGAVDRSQFGPANADMLKLAREIRMMSQREVAEAAEIPASRLSQYERGKREAPAEDIKLIAEALDFPASFFYQVGKRGPPNPWAEVCRRGL